VVVLGPGSAWATGAAAPGPLVAAAIAGSGFLLLAAAALAWVVLRLWQQQGRLLLRIEALEASGARAAGDHVVPFVSGLATGTAAPDLALRDLDGRTRRLHRLRPEGKPLLLIFVDAGCGPCDLLLPRVAEWQRGHAGAFRVAVIAAGDAGVNRDRAEKYGLEDVLLAPDATAGEAYGIPGTPAAVVIGTGGRVARPLEAGVGPIAKLVDELVDASSEHPAGDVAPARQRGTGLAALQRM
jgi:thiol-disulfide isomerase/thioredoxin